MIMPSTTTLIHTPMSTLKRYDKKIEVVTRYQAETDNLILKAINKKFFYL